MKPAGVLEADRTPWVTEARESMIHQESPIQAVALVDIMSGSDDETVSFTSAWETED